MSMKDVVNSWAYENKQISDFLLESRQYQLLASFNSLLWALDNMAKLIDDNNNTHKAIADILGGSNDEK